MEKNPKNKKVIQLEVVDDLEDSGVSSIALVDEPAIEKYFVYMRNEKFVEPSAGESQSDFMGRCVPAMLDEGKDQDQAVAMCISMYEQKHGKQKFADYPWEQCISDAADRGLDEESQKALCGWIRWNMGDESFDFQPGSLPPYVEQAPKKKEMTTKLRKEVASKLIPSSDKFVFAVDKADQHVLCGIAMVPDMEIFRKDENGDPYYVKFSAETIAKIQEKFMRELRNQATNLDHMEDTPAGAYVFESYIVEDPASDKANTVYNLGAPKGAWIVKMRVTNEKVWQAIKAGKYKGFSIEGNFIDKEELDKIEQDKNLLEQIMNILES